ncbi:endo-1,4-beta-xylanase [Beijerinckia indica]|uniref:endo-1,4-beta-xylanase n=1 Tax=Beijerinckia indica subsp. indica (strain ATCC 9039 / DSM 1715 / NCIMB 8712) TaxID=395963 RepID=B2IJA6_BEII9|nr:endo-1,4-beta-xylanase [Beijerinckia indica]ACB96224.1 Endo-1,4-beta-xylanase [Beijerinckia indica subsp. indica ATCC 9039]
MRLLLFTSEFYPLRGGIGTYAAELARGATELGGDVTLYAPSYHQDLADDDLKCFPFRVIRYAGHRHTMKNLPQKLQIVRRAVRSETFDIIHAMDWPFFLPVHLMAPSKVHKLFTVHGSDVNEMRAPVKATIISLVRLFSGKSEILANSNFTRSLFNQHFPDIPPHKVKTEWLGVSDFWFQPAANRSETRFKLGVADDAYVILTVGRLTPRKGHLSVIEALSRLPERIKEHTIYIIVGPHYDGEYTSKVKVAAAASGCKTLFLNELSDDVLRDLYKACDVFCLTGHTKLNGLVEGFGLVYLEAGAQGLPSIAGNVGGMPEAVEHGKSGLVVNSNDADSIAQSLCELHDLPRFRQALADGALERAKILTWRRCVAASYGFSSHHAKWLQPHSSPISLTSDITQPQNGLARRSVLGAFASVGLLKTKILAATPTTILPLKQAAARVGLLFGCAFDKIAISDAAYGALIKTHAAILTTDYHMKFKALRRNGPEADFTIADSLITFADAASIPIRGHNLIWNEGNPDWLIKLPANERIEWLERHIKEVMGRYRGRIHSWDVVNEPFWPGHKKPGGFRDGPWYSALGPEYIIKAFQIARRTDPSAKLVLNEAWVERSDDLGLVVREELFKLLQDLSVRGLIDAVGLECHIRPHYTRNFDILAQFIAKVSTLGIDVYITELDVDDSIFSGSMSEIDDKVAEIYGDFVRAITKAPAVKILETWQLADRYSFYQDQRKGTARPLPFDTSLAPKPAYHTIISALIDAGSQPVGVVRTPQH